MIHKLLIFLGWGIIFFLACAHEPNVKTGDDIQAKKSLYRLGYGDVLEIKFFDNQRFSREVSVRPDGRITLEKVGDIYVAGLTTPEVDSIVTDKFRDILKSPDVTVFIKNFSNQKVYVLGEVNMPGGYFIEREMTVTHAIALAGGYKRSANLRSVLIVRKSENGELFAERINMKNILSSKVKGEDKYIQAMDVVYVPRTFISNVDVFIDQFFDLVLPPVDVFWRLWFIEKTSNY